MIDRIFGGETGFLAGFLVGISAGIVLCRWLWINGQKMKERLRKEDD